MGDYPSDAVRLNPRTPKPRLQEQEQPGEAVLRGGVGSGASNGQTPPPWSLSKTTTPATTQPVPPDPLKVWEKYGPLTSDNRPLANQLNTTGAFTIGKEPEPAQWPKQGDLPDTVVGWIPDPKLTERLHSLGVDQTVYVPISSEDNAALLRKKGWDVGPDVGPGHGAHVGPSSGDRAVPGKDMARTDFETNSLGSGGVAKQLTADQYEALTPEQRQVVDFNTLLVKATDKDDAGGYKPSDAQRKTYDDQVEKMFGEGHGSDTYAPETVALLQQLGYHNEQSDLDDFLGLRTAVTARELRDFTSAQAQPAAANLQEGLQEASRNGLIGDLAHRTAELQKTLVQGDRLLQDFQSGAAKARNQLVAALGGTENVVGNQLGYGTSKLDDDFRSAFDVIANATNKNRLGEFVNDVATGTGWDSKTQDAFWSYVDSRTRNAEQYGLQLGETANVSYLKPDELRSLMGLDKQKGAGHA